MSKITFQSFPHKLVTYGIIPSLCLSGFLLANDTSIKKDSLVILEGRNQGQVPEGANLQQKVKFLTHLANEQSEKIRNLREEVQLLKNKLHVAQLSLLSEEKGNYKQLYTALKKEATQIKETKDQLEKISAQLKQDNEEKKLKSHEDDAQIINLMSALESHAFALDKLKENYEKELASLSTSESQAKQERFKKVIIQLKKKNKAEQEKNLAAQEQIKTLMAAIEQQQNQAGDDQYKQLYANLEKESQQKQNKLQKIHQQLKKKYRLEKQKSEEVEAHLIALITALELETLVLTQRDQHFRKELESIFLEKNRESYPELLATLETDLARNKEKQDELEEIIFQLKRNNALEKHKLEESNSQLAQLMTALELQTLAMTYKEQPTQEVMPVALSFEQQEYQQLKKENASYLHQITELENELKNYHNTLAQFEEELINQKKIIDDREMDFASLVEKMEAVAEGPIRDLFDAWQTEHILLKKEQQNFLKLYQEFLAENENVNEKMSEDSINWNTLYFAFENEQLLRMFAEKSQGNSSNLVETDVLAVQEALQGLHNEYEQKIQQIIQLKEQEKEQALNDLNHQLAEIQRRWEAEKQSSVLRETQEYSHLSDALEVSNLQHAHAVNNTKQETEENVQQLLERLNEERAKTELTQKNLDELQQIYDQTVKLYNEIYSDHKFVQKQLENAHKDLDENKMNHLVELDSVEAKMENLARELKNEQELSQELQVRLSATQEEIGTLKVFEKEKNDANKIKNASISHLETLSLQENLLKQTFQELEHHKKVISDQEQMLKQVYQDKLQLVNQLQAIPLTPAEIAQLQKNTESLKYEIEGLKAAQLQQMQANAAQEDLMTQSQIELERYKQIGGELEGTVKELLDRKDSQAIALREKQEEIQSLMAQMKQAEEQFNLQLQEFMALLEAEKFKNFEFERELENRNVLSESNHQTLQDVTEELERLKNEIALKDQSLLVQKIEVGDLQERLREMKGEQDKIQLQMQMAEEGQKAFVEQQSKEAIAKHTALLKEQHEKEIESLKQQLKAQTEQVASEGDAKIMAIQLERLQEALQQMVSEKTALQSQVQNQIFTEKMLTEKLEETLAELEQYKNSSQ